MKKLISALLIGCLLMFTSHVAYSLEKTFHVEKASKTELHEVTSVETIDLLVFPACAPDLVRCESIVIYSVSLKEKVSKPVKANDDVALLDDRIRVQDNSWCYLIHNTEYKLPISEPHYPELRSPKIIPYRC